MSQKLAWGIIGAGSIAKALAEALPQSRTGKLVGVASRDAAKAEAFAKQFNAPKSYGSYQALLDDPEIQAVYIATPHPMHAEWAIKAADAKKHILCEKPIALNANDTQAIIEAARRNDVFLMEAFMYRCNPLTKKLVELVRDKAIGDVRLIRATFAFHAGYNLQSRLLNNRLGGGGILDVGCYATSMSRLIAGAALGKDFEDPVEVKATGHVGAESRCDEWAIASLKFPGNIVAQCATGVQLGLDNEVVVFGSAGNIRVPTPWFACGRKGGTGSIFVNRAGKPAEEVRVEAGWLYAIEADAVGDNLDKRQAPSPCMSWADTLGNMRTLDRWREQIGVSYELEQAGGYAEPLDRRPLTVRAPNKMTYGELPGVNKKISKLVMGSMVFGSISKTAVSCDEFFARGGNCFDTAYVYGPNSQKNFGQWVKMRGIREQVVVIAKGAHTPCCTPDGMRKQLTESLELMQTDYTDIYFLHRDNPDVPAGEFVDALDAEVRAGRIRAFGGSNWTTARLDAANAYARQHGKTGFAAVSNNFSLARMVKAVWDGCIASSESAFHAWHIEKKFPLFAWSSQARGFFVPGRAAPDKRDEKSLVECWYSDDNFARQRRCFELAKKRSVEPVSIALAYVLHQPFPIWALIGPDNLAEIRTSFDALSVSLTPSEVKWLNSGD